MGTTLTRHHSRILIQEYFPVYPQMESVWANNCRSVFASSTPTSKETVNRCAEALGVGIRYISVIIEALGSYNEDSRYLGYLGYLGYAEL